MRTKPSPVGGRNLISNRTTLSIPGRPKLGAQDPAPSRSGSPMGSPTVEVIQSELPVEAAVSSESEPGTEVLEGQTSPVESRNAAWRNSCDR